MDYEVTDAELEAATAEMNKVRKSWLRRPGVTALDVGFAFKDGVMTNQLAVRVHVSQKLPEEALESYEIFPDDLNGIPVDVIEAEYAPQTLESLE
jgi:hypothetical protein